MTPEDAGPSIEEIRGVADPGTAGSGHDAGSRLTTADGGGAVVEASPPTPDPRDRAVGGGEAGARVRAPIGRPGVRDTADLFDGRSASSGVTLSQQPSCVGKETLVLWITS